jgi:hypothetical protein
LHSLEIYKDNNKIMQKTGIRNLIKEKVQKLKEGSLACPLCRETFQGISELLRHLKDHCT